MDFGTHLLTGILLAIFLQLSQFNLWYLAILGAVLPDLIGELVYYIGLWKKTKRFTIFYDKEITASSKEFSNSYYMIPYNFLHSFISVILLLILGFPEEFMLGYVSHILIDIISHAKENWGIMMLWPFSKKRVGPKTNWWEWKIMEGKKLIWFNIVNYIISLSLIYIIFWLIQHLQ